MEHTHTQCFIYQMPLALRQQLFPSLSRTCRLFTKVDRKSVARCCQNKKPPAPPVYYVTWWRHNTFAEGTTTPANQLKATVPCFPPPSNNHEKAWSMLEWWSSFRARILPLMKIKVHVQLCTCQKSLSLKDASADDIPFFSFLSRAWTSSGNRLTFEQTTTKLLRASQRICNGVLWWMLDNEKESIHMGFGLNWGASTD